MEQEGIVMAQRNWDQIEKFYNELLPDIYEQPDNEGHTKLAKDVIDKWMPEIKDIRDVLDVGCGTGFCYEFFSLYHIEYVGIASGIRSEKPRIFDVDYNFSGYSDEDFDLIFSRHSLEHSPFPILTLMEWHRIAKKYLILVLPNPDYYTYIGRNHYSVMNKQQTKWLLRRAGWKVMETDYSEHTELRFLCEKMPRLGVEGYVEQLSTKIYEADRDD